MRHASALFSILIVCSSALSQNNNKPEYRDPDAAAIYSAILGKAIPKGHVPVIASETSAGINRSHDAECLRNTKAPNQSLVERFLEENRSPLLLPNDLRLTFSHKFVPQSDLDKMFAKGQVIDGWKKFYDRYPNSGGFYQFSAIAYDKTGTVALVYLAHSCDWLCGQGRYAILKKIHGKWREEKQSPSCGWIS